MLDVMKQPIVILIGIFFSLTILSYCSTTKEDKEEKTISEGPFGKEVINTTFSSETFESEFGFQPTPDIKPICYWSDYSGIDGFNELTFECNDQTFEKIIKKLGMTLGEFDQEYDGENDKCKWLDSKRVKKIKFYWKQEKQFHWNLWYDKEKKLVHYSSWNT
jgi:hypothetical protein